MTNQSNKPLCKDGWAVPPTELMLSKGNNYYTCSKCGKPCDAPIEPEENQSNELRERVSKLVWGGKTDVDGILSLIQERERLARIDEVKRMVGVLPERFYRERLEELQGEDKS